MVTPFTWKKKDLEIKITSLEELLSALTNIQQEDIDQEITDNVIGDGLLKWLQQNFPKKLQLITSLKNMLTKFTPQQTREMLIRELQKITSAS